MWLKQKFIFQSSQVEKSKIKLTDSVNDESCLPGLQMTTLSSHGLSSECCGGERKENGGGEREASFNLNYPYKGPVSKNLGVENLGRIQYGWRQYMIVWLLYQKCIVASYNKLAVFLALLFWGRDCEALIHFKCLYMFFLLL